MNAEERIFQAYQELDNMGTEDRDQRIIESKYQLAMILSEILDSRGGYVHPGWRVTLDKSISVRNARKTT